MSGFPVTYAERIKTLPPYLFAAIDDMKQQAVARGVDIINLGVGDPDLPTPAPIIKRLQEAAADPAHHQYPSYDGMLSFRTAVANWYRKRFHVTADPKSEVLTLIGSKEGIGHVPMAFVDPGDVVLVPSPGYPVYPVAASFAGGRAYEMPLLKQRGFLPDLDAVPRDILKQAKLMYLNSPNNPTSVIADVTFFQRVVDFAKEHHVIVCHDAAYSEIFYDGAAPAEFSGSRRSHGRGHRMSLPVQDVQHDGMAPWVCGGAGKRSSRDWARSKATWIPESFRRFKRRASRHWNWTIN